MNRNVLVDYLGEISRIRATGAGTGEISYYPALRDALNTIGAQLRPRVFCVPNLADAASQFHTPMEMIFLPIRSSKMTEWRVYLNGGKKRDLLSKDSGAEWSFNYRDSSFI